MAQIDRAATHRRDAGLVRVRLATALAVVAGALLTFALAALAAASTHTRSVVRHVVRPRARSGAVVAPAPPLVSSGNATQAPPPSSPAPSPAPAAAEPVVVSGGS